MDDNSPTDGEVLVKLEGHTQIEQDLQDIIDGKSRAPAGPCHVVSSNVLTDVINTMKSLRAKLHDK